MRRNYEQIYVGRIVCLENLMVMAFVTRGRLYESGPDDWRERVVTSSVCAAYPCATRNGAFSSTPIPMNSQRGAMRNEHVFEVGVKGGCRSQMHPSWKLGCARFDYALNSIIDPNERKGGNAKELLVVVRACVGAACRGSSLRRRLAGGEVASVTAEECS